MDPLNNKNSKYSTMETNNFKLTLQTEQSPAEVFEAIKKVRDWWSGFYSEEIEGKSEKLGDEFNFRAADGAHFSKQKLIEVIPNKKIVWLITESKFTFIEKQNEWTGTKVIFEIAKNNGKTELIFTHEGLTPKSECYNDCAPGWTLYLEKKLRPMISGAVMA